MDEELKQYLDELKRHLDGKFAEVDRKFAEIDRKFATKEDLEQVETALLTEFHKWASPAEARTNSHTATLRAIDLEMEVLTARVKKLENKS